MKPNVKLVTYKQYGSGSPGQEPQAILVSSFRKVDLVVRRLRWGVITSLGRSYSCVVSRITIARRLGLVLPILSSAL